VSAVLLTGGARRIGAHLARRLAARGLAVAVHYRASRDEAEALAAAIRAEGGTAVALAADLAEPAALADLVDRAAAALGPLGCLVNNASTFEIDHARDFTLDTWDRQLAVNLRAPVVLAQRFAGQVPDGTTGLVVNLLDHMIAAPPQGYFTYMVAKRALASATELLAAQLAPRVRVNAIAPGLTLPSGRQSEADFARLRDATPLGRGNALDDLARALDYLLDAEAVTGEILFVDGGRRLGRGGASRRQGR
jgi:NAD(P)-dependent dehydrogenase (short-subunit alcohol dehydrogenase family)